MAKRLCGNCFSRIKGNVCPVCGHAERHSSAEYDALKTGSELGGRYIVGRVLGRGGFGITYLAYDEKKEKTVAVKEYYPDEAAVRIDDNMTVEPMTSRHEERFTEGLERFLSEAEIISRFGESSEILGVYDVFRANGTAYYAMEFIKGVSLKKYVEANGAVTEGQAVHIAKKLLPALSVIHSENILHRDVCPDNIMLCANGAVRLIDFGSAKRMDEKSQSMSVILKPGFAPIEQYRRKGRQDGRTDIYSLGASLYYGLTLEAPEDPLTRLDTDDVFPEKLRNISEGLARVITRSAAVKPEDRYESAADMLTELKNCGVEEEEFLTEKIYYNAGEAAKRPIKRKKAPAAVLTAAYRATEAVKEAVGGLFYNEGEVMVKIGGEMFSVNAETLDLSGMRINHTQISNLRHLKNLTYLNLNDNHILELSCLSGLTKLEHLYFNNNNITDISFLKDMKHLKTISGENSGVSDISVLEDKTELETVFFGNSYVTDISPIKNCRRLREVGFVESEIGSIEALRGMTALEKVCFSGCGLTDISPLSDSKGIRYVYLGRNALTDLSALSGCDIAELYIDNNELSGHTDTFEGITLNGFACIEGNRFSGEEIERLSRIFKGKFDIYY